MKTKKTVPGLKLLAITIVISMLCMTSVFAADSDSSIVVRTVGNHSYNIWSTVYVDSNCRASSWVQEQNNANVPVNNLGVDAQLFSESGNLLESTGMTYNQSPTYFHFASTPGVYHSGRVYSKGTIKIYTGTGYETFDAPQTAYLSRSAALTALEATLDESGNYLTNMHGETYGSALLSEIVGEQPDLIAAVGVDDVYGYVRADDLNPEISDTTEAAAYMATLEENKTIPLYDVNGTAIGTFVLSKAQVGELEKMDIETAKAALKDTFYSISTLGVAQASNNTYPKNDKGETYGNDLMAQKLGFKPDFIAAIGTNGQEGFVRNDELNRDDVSTPEEAAEYMKNRASTYTIPLYDQNGSVIGEFRIASSDLSIEEINAQLAVRK